MTNTAAHRSLDFQRLVDEVAACRQCPRMAHSARMLGHSVGNLRADVMFVGEAPGRLGADQTHIPFHGDAAGQNFEDLIAFVGIRREDIYISNCVLCNPRDERGNNATPNPSEVSNCSGYLRRQIDLVSPKVVVSLGATSLRALAAVEQHSLNLKDHVRTSHGWYGRLLVPLYHPGQRAMIHRSHANQRSDYQFVADTLRRLDSAKSRAVSATRADVLAACQFIIGRRKEVSYFELHKLAYLAEYLHVKRTGERLTSAFFIRQKDGPYCVDLNVQRLKKADTNVVIKNRSGKLFLALSDVSKLSLYDDGPDLDNAIKRTLEEVVDRYRYPSDADLKRAVYLTAPMRMMLRREKNEGANLYNAPIDFLSV
jgi:uracil-DNA glycosylase family 4